MNINDQIFYKAELLTKGMRASDNAKAILYKEFPRLFHKRNNAQPERNVGNELQRQYRRRLRARIALSSGRKGRQFYNGRKTVSQGRAPTSPARSWTTLQGPPKVALRSGRTVIAVMTRKRKCRFCSIVKERETPLDADVLADSIKNFELSKDNMLNFSGGTYKNPDVMADYWIDLSKNPCVSTRKSQSSLPRRPT